MSLTAQELNLKALSSIADFAAAVGYSETRIRRCARQTETVDGWPPLPAKHMPDGQLRITAADGAAWINSLQDA